MPTLINTLSYLVLVTAILIEATIWKRQNKSYYNFGDTSIDLTTFFSTQLLNMIIFIPLTVWFYRFLAQGVSIYKFQMENAWHWGLCYLTVDFLYYWMHRAGHRVAILWGLHVVHHQSEEFNLIAGLRKAWMTRVMYIIFFAPLPLLGFPEPMLIMCIEGNLFYQFFVHVRDIPKLGFLEWFLCTPSAHRVHHGTNPQYLDKNYGGVLIIWDRIFGTFEPEIEAPRYGITNPVKSWDLVEVNGAFYRDIRGQLANLSFTKALQLVFAPPQSMGSAPDRKPIPIPQVPRKWYTFFMIIFSLTVPILLDYQNLITKEALWVITLTLIFGQIALSRSIDRNAWSESINKNEGQSPRGKRQRLNPSESLSSNSLDL